MYLIIALIGVTILIGLINKPKHSKNCSDFAHTITELQQQKKDFILLDIRTPQEYAQGRIPGARMLDFYDASFSQKLSDLPRDACYLLYCRSGIRSGKALRLMQKLGFKDCCDLLGGITAWKQKGGDLEI
jgi:rhodanese-related sulfurtransferase